MPYLYRCD